MPYHADRKTHPHIRPALFPFARKAAKPFPVVYHSLLKHMRILHLNAISASICLLGCGLALPVFSQQPEKGKPDAAHISKTKADWWSQRHALLKQTLAETPCQLLFIGDSITHRWETDGKKIWSQYFSSYAPVNFGIGGDRTEHILWRIDDSALKTPHSPQVCVIMVGTNNTGLY